MQLLDKYTKAAQAVAAFKEKHSKIFDEFNSYLEEQEAAELALKKEVRENVKGNIQNEFVRVTYSPAFKTFYDPAIVFEMVKPKQRKAIEDAGALKQEIDRKKFDELVELGVIDKSVAQAAFKEIEMTPRVLINENK